MLVNAYESTLLKSFNFFNVLSGIKKAALTDALPDVFPNIKMVTELHKSVPQFTYPILDKENNLVYIDGRTFTVIQKDGTYKVRNDLEFNLHLRMAKMELAWHRSNNTDRIYNAIGLSREVFTKWLSRTISFRYGLEPYQQAKLTAVCAIYTLGLFYNNLEEGREKKRLITGSIGDLPVDAATAFEVADTIGNIPRDAGEFVEAIREADISSSLKDFDERALYAMIANSWFMNTGSSILVGVGLEYPPAFASLVYMAIENRVYKNTAIAKVVNEISNSSKNGYMRGFELYLDQYLDE